MFSELTFALLPHDVLISENWASEALGKSVEVFRHWRENGIGPKAFRVQGAFYYRAGDLNTYPIKLKVKIYIYPDGRFSWEEEQ